MKISKLLTNKYFIYLWTSQMLSQATLNLLLFLVIIRLFEQTGSTIATSLIWIAYALPAVLIGPFAAVTPDIFDKRKILMLANFLQAITLVLFAIFFERNLYSAYLAIFFYSFFNQFYVPTESSALPVLLDKKYYPQANGIFFLTQQSGVIIGFGAGAALNGFLGFSNTLLLGTAAIVLAFLSVSLLPEMKIKKEVQEEYEKGLTKYFYHIKEGYLFIKHNKVLVLPFLLIMSMQVSLAVLGANLPVIATDMLQIPANSSGFTIVLPAGIGAGLGTYLASKALHHGWRKKRLINVSLSVIAAGVWLAVIALPILNPTSRIVLGMAIFALIGIAFSGILVPSQTFLQEATPGGLLGRVLGNFWLLGTLATIVPVIFSATVTELFGVRALFVLLGGVSAGGVILANYHERST